MDLGVADLATPNDFVANREQDIVTDEAILDFPKVFNTVDHHKLLLKLEKYGIKIILLNGYQTSLLIDNRWLLLKKSFQTPVAFAKVCLTVQCWGFFYSFCT